MILRPRHRIGNWRIERLLSRGGFADVYQAYDTVEGVMVALKVPHPHLLGAEALRNFRHEIRVTNRLDHPNILPIKTVHYDGQRLVIVYPLGQCTLADRLQRRLATRTALDYAAQFLDALAHAHARGIIHCDVKPENMILFPENRLRLADFGIAKLAFRTLRAAGTGTVGYVAPEQAMGRPSPRSDVFSAGLTLWRMLAGTLPEWPFEWPLAGHDRVRRRVRPEFVDFLRRALAVDPKARYENAGRMLEAFRRLRPRALPGPRPAARRRQAGERKTTDWRAVRRRAFLRRFGRVLAARHRCSRCGEPVAEGMQACPGCGTPRRRHTGPTRFPARCPRCRRGVKLDWRYCAWCRGPRIGPRSRRRYTDLEYRATCSHAGCKGPLLPFSRYCPWCGRRVRRRWLLPEHRERCPGCGWGVAREFWSSCPWCGRDLARTRRRRSGAR